MSEGEFNEKKFFFPMSKRKCNTIIFTNDPDTCDEKVFEAFLKVLFEEKYKEDNFLLQIQNESQLFEDRWKEFFYNYFWISRDNKIPLDQALRRLEIDYNSLGKDDEMSIFDTRKIRTVLPKIFIECALELY